MVTYLRMGIETYWLRVMPRGMAKDCETLMAIRSQRGKMMARLMGSRMQMAIAWAMQMETPMVMEIMTYYQMVMR